jgi:hypothetical protein
MVSRFTDLDRGFFGILNPEKGSAEKIDRIYSVDLSWLSSGNCGYHLGTFLISA